MTQLPPPTPGATLKRLREAKGLTQQGLADKLGKSRTAVAAWEYGRAMSLKSRAAVAKLLGVEPDVLGPPWDPNGARPQYRRRAREEAAYMEKLRALGGDVESTTRPLVGVSPDDTRGVASPDILPTTIERRSDMLNVPDADQFAKVLGFWCAMEPEKRLALVREAWSLASPEVVVTPERRGKAQG